MKRTIVILLLLCATAVAAAQSRVPVPDIAPGKGAQCVEPTQIMRRDHMKFLMHQRDDTVHRGIRTTKHSLVGCIGCHAQRDANGQPIPVNAPGQFCESCHSYAAVKVDCFDCHATVPQEQSARGAAQ